MEITENNNAHSTPEQEISKTTVEQERNELYLGEKSFAPIDSNMEPPLSVYEQMKGTPYTIIHFDLNSELFNDKELLRDGHTMKMARDIDNFVINEIQHKQLFDSVETYSDTINKLRTQLKINALERNDVVLTKIHAFVKKYRGKSAYKKL